MNNDKRQYRDDIKVWMVQFSKPMLRHTEFITGSKKQVEEYVKDTCRFYACEASTPIYANVPVNIGKDEKVVNLIR